MVVQAHPIDVFVFITRHVPWVLINSVTQRESGVIRVGWEGWGGCVDVVEYPFTSTDMQGERVQHERSRSLPFRKLSELNNAKDNTENGAVCD